MPKESLQFTQASLWEKVLQQSQHALQCGALQPIPTEYEVIEQNGIPFLVRILSNLARKDEAKEKQTKKPGKDFNPFLPYDKDLFVSDISSTHVCLLNKFNVVDHHLLIVTREFEEQETWLTQQDFEAMSACLAQVDGLAFYNGGQVAGASQKHKHLQLIRFPLMPTGENLPITSVIANAQFHKGMGQIPNLPFVHAIAHLNTLDPSECLASYSQLLTAVGLWQPENPGTHQTGAYNFLATREWMLIIPRSQEHFQSISINSLGFAGALLVRNSEQLQLLKEHTPLSVLTAVACS